MVSSGATIGDLWRARLATDPDGELVGIQGRWYSARDLEPEIARVAAGFAALGAGGGGRVAIVLPNVVEFVVSMMAAWRAGGIAVPLHVTSSVPVLLAQISDASPSILVTRSDHLELASKSGPPHTVIVGTRDVPVGLPASPWSEVGREVPPESAAVEAADSTAMLCYTGGTTGAPKACALSHRCLINRAGRVQHITGRTGDDRIWTGMPLSHTNPFQFGVLGSLLTGGSAYIAERFDPTTFWDDVRAAGATMVTALGSAMALVLAEEDPLEKPDKRLRVVAVPSSTEQVEAFRRRFGVELFGHIYGMTEAGPLAGGRDVCDSFGCVGPINSADFEVAIHAPDDTPVAPEAVGQICVRPSQPGVMFEGYWQKPSETLSHVRNLWFHTGDAGSISRDGCLHVLDRIADLLEIEGTLLSPSVVENRLRSIAGVRDCAVVGNAGVVQVFVELAADMASVEPAIRDALAAESPGMGNAIISESVLPRSGVGRVQRGQLRSKGPSGAE